MCCASARSSRMIVEECLKWAAQRYVFGKPLLAQAVIRQKFAHMIAKVEAIQAWLESVTFQMCNMVSDTSSLYAVSGSIIGRTGG